MKILITGGLGYIGFPLVCELEEMTEHRIVVVDNESRQQWVDRVGGKQYVVTRNGNTERKIVLRGDLTDRAFVNEVLATHRPDIVIHLASQPSMPYSQINGERATFTQVNNLVMLVNLLWGIKEHKLHSRVICTTTTGIPGQHYARIPENHTINMAGSWYHVSRGFDSANMRLASMQWGLDCIEFRTSIVYGVDTSTLQEKRLLTRFDTDFYFGTVVNRFVQQALDGKAITIYGKGEQLKPFIALEDVVQSLKKAIEYPFDKGHTILNQVTENLSIVQLAKIIQKETDCDVVHVDNPRKENEAHSMVFDNDKFLRLLAKTPRLMSDELPIMISSLTKTNGLTTSYAMNSYFGGSGN